MSGIGYLVPEFPSQTHSFFWREVRAMRALGARVRLISTARPEPGSCQHEFAAPAAAETEYLFPAGTRPLLYLLSHPRRAMRAMRYVLGLAETPPARRLLLLGLIPSAARLLLFAKDNDLSHVHIHSCANSAHLGALAHLMGGLGYSLTLHGDLPIYGTDHRAKMRNARFVACVTRPLREQVIAETGLDVARVPVLWMGVDMAKFARSAPRAGSRGTLRAITVARLNWQKGHRFALRALQQLKAEGVSVEYLIVGDGPYGRDVLEEVRAAGLEKETQVLGAISEDEVANRLMQSDVLILPSVGKGEAAPVAVMEAMACGLPVVASIIGGTPDMIEDGIDGYLCAQQDVDCITCRLRELAQDTAARERIGTAARSRAAREFDARQLAGRLLTQINGS